MRTTLLATAAALLIAGPAFAGPLVENHTTNNTPIAGAASNANAGAVSGSLSALQSDPSASSGGNQFSSKSGSTTAVAVAPPSFGGNLSNAAGQEGYILSNSFGFPIIGGGQASSEVVPTVAGMERLVNYTFKMKVEADPARADLMKAALCTYYGGFAEAAHTVCE